MDDGSLVMAYEPGIINVNGLDNIVDVNPEFPAEKSPLTIILGDLISASTISVSVPVVDTDHDAESIETGTDETFQSSDKISQAEETFTSV